MTDYLPPLDQRPGAGESALLRRISYLEQRLNQLVIGVVPCTSTTHPANPAVGMQILETDTGLTATWNGTTWVYAAGVLLDHKVLSASQPSLALTVPAGITVGSLEVRYSVRQDNGSGGAWGFLQINGDAGANYTWETLSGNNATVASANAGGAVMGVRYGVIPGASDTANYYGSGVITIENASSTATYKPVAARFGGPISATNGYTGTTGGLWASTAVVSSVALFPFSGNLVANSRATLIGWP